MTEDASTDSLLTRLDRGRARRPVDILQSALMMAALGVILALARVLPEPAATATFALAFGCSLAAWAFLAARKLARLPAQPVRRAVRSNPAAVTTIAHEISLGSHWIEVKTSDGRLFVKANDDWEQLLAQLARRCPDATVIR